ncbi:MAG TPA: alcohol dehydrogenase [Planctomycetaceae bacterium]|nr:alcohol dehydrogenase [Planctomycetaceae bacterium]
MLVPCNGWLAYIAIRCRINKIDEMPNREPTETPYDPTGASQTPEQPAKDYYRPLRLWMVIPLLLLMVVARFVPGLVQDGPAMIWMVSAFGPFLVGLLVLAWWLIASGARWTERIVGLVGIVAVFVLVTIGLDKSMQGPLVIVMMIPMGIAGFAIGLIAAGRQLSFSRTWVGLGVGLIAAAFPLTLQNFGTFGDFSFDLDWRWNATPEQRFMAERNQRDGAPTTAIESVGNDFVDPPWPGFRGPNRDGKQFGTVVDSDWSAAPEELWRIKVGPGWSSFAATDRLLFTQEQRGPKDAVVCYVAETGDEVWANEIESRFFEALGGLGPRSTPTIYGENVYAMCAEGFLRCLRGEDGAEVWSVDVREIANAAIPMWGFSSSPFVNEEIVAVHAGGDGDYGVIAVDRLTGELVWNARAGKQSYSSLQQIEVAGQTYLAILTDQGAQLHDPSNGRIMLDYAWEHSGYRALQAQLVDGNKLVIPTGMGTGTRLVEIERGSDGKLDAKELWTSRRLKPDFNDLVEHNGFLYGFDGRIFACINVEDGKLQWKGGRYGKGQVLLLADSDLLIVAAENGELAVVRTTPEKHTELGRFPALDGKTWNHPVAVGGRLFLRNAEEAVCFVLPLATQDSSADLGTAAAEAESN